VLRAHSTNSHSKHDDFYLRYTSINSDTASRTVLHALRSKVTVADCTAQVEFAIKHYSQGAFTSVLSKLPVGPPPTMSTRSHATDAAFHFAHTNIRRQDQR
jgi:hypothetical protein